METKKRQPGATAPGSLVYWSSPLRQQPARVLIVEALPPWWSRTCVLLCEALDNFLSLACSLDGPCRIPLLSVYAISRQQECVLPFVPIRGNLSRLRSCVEDLRSLPVEGCTKGHAREAEMLRQAVLDSLQQFKQYVRCTAATGNQKSNMCVEVTVVSSRAGRVTVRQLESGLRGADLVSLRRLLVVQIYSDEDWAHDDASPKAKHTESEEDSLPGLEVDLQQVDGSVFAMETVLKAWLQEQGGDREHLHLLLPSPPETPLPVCIKCDMQERLLSPALVPLAPDLGAKTESARDFSPVAKGSANRSAAPQRLRAIKALEADGVCESVLYGLPLVVRPTTCWQLDWDEMESNHQLFHALCHTLLSRDLFLLLQVEPTQRSPAGGSGVYSHYALLPSASLSLLLKPVVSRELLLPCSPPVPAQDPTPDALQLIQGCVTQLDKECVFNPLSLSTNLYQHLRSPELLSQPRYPYRFQASGRRCQAPPAEGAKTASGKQPRQGRQPAASSRARAAVAPMPSAASSSSVGPPPAKAARPVLTFRSGGGGGGGRGNRRAPPAEEDEEDDSVVIL